MKTRHKAQGRIDTRKMAQPKAKPSQNAPSPIPALPSRGEECFLLHCRVYHIEVEREYRFHDKRRWRFDFAVPSRKLGIEIEGGIWQNGRHQRADGFTKDIVKYNTATLLGWRVLRFTTGMVERGEAIDTVRAALGRA